MPNYGFWQGAERATRDAGNKAMGFMKYAASREDAAADRLYQNERLELARKQDLRAENKAKADAEQSRKDNTLIPFNENLDKLGFKYPEEKEVFKKYFGGSLETDPVTGLPHIRAKYAREGWESLQKNKDALIELNTATIKGVQRDIDSITTALNDPESKLKPEQLEEITKQKDALLQRRTAMVNKVNRLSNIKSPETIRSEARASAEGTTEGAGQKWSAPQKGIDENGNAIVYRVDQNNNVEVLGGVRPELKKGMKITTADGTTIEVGGSGSGLTTKSKGAVEGKLLAGSEQYARIKAITSEFKPEFQEIGTRLSNAWTGLKAKLGRGISKEDERSLIEFKAFQRKSIENINLYIKEMTGAQMSEKEASRLRLAQPDPGEKWYKGDDPITFKAKMDDVEKTIRAVVARYEYYNSKGLSGSEISGLINSGAAVSLEEIKGGLK